VRYAFSDESYGEGPWFVVAGPIVHADSELIPIEDHVQAIAAKYIPEEDRDGFVFHAADIWNNNQYFKDRTVWPRSRCWDVIWDLARMPAQFGLPIALGIKGHREVAEWIKPFTDPMDKREVLLTRSVTTHTLAYIDFLHGVEECNA